MNKRITDPEDYVPERNGESMNKLFEVLMRTAVIVTVGIVGWNINLVLDLKDAVAEVDKRVSVIEGSRFTSNDAQKLILDFISRVDEMKHQMHKIEKALAKLPSEIPPQWFKEKVMDNDKRINKLEDKAR